MSFKYETEKELFYVESSPSYERSRSRLESSWFQKNWRLSAKPIDYIMNLGYQNSTLKCHRELLIFAQDVIDCAMVDIHYRSSAKSLFACAKRLRAPKFMLGEEEKIALWFIDEVRKTLDSRSMGMLTSEG